MLTEGEYINYVMLYTDSMLRISVNYCKTMQDAAYGLSGTGTYAKSGRE